VKTSYLAQVEIVPALRIHSIKTGGGVKISSIHSFPW